MNYDFSDQHKQKIRKQYQLVVLKKAALNAKLNAANEKIQEAHNKLLEAEAAYNKLHEELYEDLTGDHADVELSIEVFRQMIEQSMEARFGVVHGGKDYVITNEEGREWARKVTEYYDSLFFVLPDKDAPVDIDPFMPYELEDMMSPLRELPGFTAADET